MNTEIVKEIFKTEKRADRLIINAKSKSASTISEAKTEQENKVQKIVEKLGDEKEKFLSKKADLITKRTEEINANTRQEIKALKNSAGKNTAAAVEFIKKAFESTINVKN